VRNLAASIASALGKTAPAAGIGGGGFGDTSTINSRNNVASISSKNGPGQALINCLNLNNHILEKTSLSASSTVNIRSSNIYPYNNARINSDNYPLIARRTLGSPETKRLN
jgi:hypothetical protein